MLKTALIAVPFVLASTSASAVDFTRTFATGNDSVNVSPNQNAGQVVTSAIGTSFTTPGNTVISGIAGESLFVTVDTTNVTSTGTFGAGIALNIAVAPGSLTSTNLADYSVILDIAANGFQLREPSLFINLFDNSDPTDPNRKVIPQQNTNQNAGFSGILAASSGNGTLSYDIPLSSFSPGVDATSFSGEVANISTIQAQFFFKSLNADYSAGAENVLVFDNVGLRVVPEPASAMLLGLGGTLLLARRRNRG